MTLLEAEQFFKAFEGKSFHMDWEDPKRHQLYKSLYIPKETEERWLDELSEKKKKNRMLTAEEYDAITERLLEMPYHVIDFLPRQVPAESDGQYFAVEVFRREEPQRNALYRKFADLLICLNCYYDLVVTNDIRWSKNPPPRELEARVAGCWESEYINILIMEEASLITLYGGDLYMTMYHASDELLKTVKQLAAAQGLFVRE